MPDEIKGSVITLKAVEIYNLFDQDKKHALIAVDMIIGITTDFNKATLYREIFKKIQQFDSVNGLFGDQP